MSNITSGSCSICGEFFGSGNLRGANCNICQCPVHVTKRECSVDYGSHFICTRCNEVLSISSASDITDAISDGTSKSIQSLGAIRCKKNVEQMKQWLEDLKMASRKHASFKNIPIILQEGYKECDTFLELYEDGLACGEDDKPIIIKVSIESISYYISFYYTFC